jgi:hypothetical protein
VEEHFGVGIRQIDAPTLPGIRQRGAMHRTSLSLDPLTETSLRPPLDHVCVPPKTSGN